MLPGFRCGRQATRGSRARFHRQKGQTLSYYHNGWEDGHGLARGRKLTHDPNQVADAGYRNGFASGQAFVARERRDAIAAGLVMVVSTITWSVHYAAGDTARDKPLCGRTTDGAPTEYGLTTANANCAECIAEATWRIAAAKAEAVL